MCSFTQTQALELKRWRTWGNLRIGLIYLMVIARIRKWGHWHITDAKDVTYVVPTPTSWFPLRQDSLAYRSAEIGLNPRQPECQGSPMQPEAWHCWTGV